MLDKDQEKMALKALLKSLLTSEEEEGPFVEERRETSVTPEEIEGELYDEGESIEEDSLETLEEDGDDDDYEEEDDDAEGTELSLKEMVAQYMNEKDDPFSDKKGMEVVEPGLEIEISRQSMMPSKPLGMKGIKMKKRKR